MAVLPFSHVRARPFSFRRVSDSLGAGAGAGSIHARGDTVGGGGGGGGGDGGGMPPFGGTDSRGDGGGARPRFESDRLDDESWEVSSIALIPGPAAIPPAAPPAAPLAPTPPLTLLSANIRDVENDTGARFAAALFLVMLAE